jgi:hypothetical protein
VKADGIPDLRRAVRGLGKKEILVPALHAALNDPDFSGFTVDVEPWTTRPADGYFHPSTQATWNVRQLALYLIAPHLVQQERMQLTGVLGITQGHFWHMFIQHVLKQTGFLIEEEVGFTDEEHRRRGHMDGLLDIRGVKEGLEIKTINPYKISKMTSAEALLELKPGYWAQAQEYLDVFDLPRMRFLFLSPSYPFTMTEFTVDADKDHQRWRRDVYKGAIAIAEAGSLPLPPGGCCNQFDTCPVRYACRTDQ